MEWARRRLDAWPLITLAILMVAGTLVRETMLLLVPVVFFVPSPSFRTRLTRTATSAIPGCLALLVTHAIAHRTNTYTFTAAARDSLSAFTPAGVVVACFIAFGAPLVLCIAYPRTALAVLRREPHLAALIGIVVILAAFGGTNTEVFLTWSIPAVFVVAGQVVETHWSEIRVAVLALLLAAQLLLARVFWPIPDYPGGQRATAVLTPLGRNIPYLDLASKFAPHGQNVAVAIQCVVLTVVVAAGRAKGSKPSPAQAP